MKNFDTILSSFKTAWGAENALVPLTRVFYDRPEEPTGYDGFPYLALFLLTAAYEVVSEPDGTNSLVTYHLTVNAYTVQNQTGGATSGDQITDQGNIQRALDAVLDSIPPNTAWNDVAGFLHCIPLPGGNVRKDETLFDGRDVLVYDATWEILVSE